VIKALNIIWYRLLWMLPTFLIGSVAIFFIQNFLPNDVVELKLISSGIQPENLNFKKEYANLYLSQGHHLPKFYLSIRPSHYHPNIHAIPDPQDRDIIKKAQQSGVDCSQIKSVADIDYQKKIRYSIPIIVWHGSPNQYQNYISNILRGNFGTSSRDGIAVSTKLKSAIKWTGLIVIINLVLSIVLSLTVVYLLSKLNNPTINELFNAISLFIISIPPFWLATLVFIFLSGSYYGLPIFYTPLGEEVHTLGDMLRRIAPVLFCFIILDIGILVRMMLLKIEEEKTKPYITALRARGLSNQKILLKHIWPNISIPISTLLINSIPVALAGSVIFELVFNINGMGSLFYNSINTADWVVTYSIILIFLVFTYLWFGLGDVWLQIRDPRLSIT
jgi:ABC-type dipeptide/oligopeptide/nickel transport system permease component